MAKKVGFRRSRKYGKRIVQQGNGSRGSWPPAAFSDDGWADASQKHHDVNLNVENTSFLDALVSAGLSLEEGTEVRVFMCGDNPSPSCREQANRLQEFCDGINLASLEGNGDIGAWLDERRLEGDVIHIRSRGKALTVFDLYLELAKPRFPSALSTACDPADDCKTPEACVSWTGASDCLSSTSLSPATIDADRRLVFIPNLDGSGIYALARTASPHQATALRGAIYRYFNRQAFIQVTPMTTDLANFQLEFHLPYYVWKTSAPRQEDPRHHLDGTPLRQTLDVSFTRWGKSDNAEFLYEAQVSCVVAGLDVKRWTAHCFTDAYFIGDDENIGDDILQDQEDGEINGGACMDPLIGIADADAPIQDPREYYLRVFGARLAQVTGEWKLAVEKMENSVDKHNQRRCYPVSESAFVESSREAKEDFQTLKRSVNDVNRVMHLSAQFANRLNQTLFEVERVLADDAHSRVFSGLPLCWPLFMAMKGELHELQRLQKALEKVEKALKTIAETLNSRLALETTQLGHDSLKLTLETMQIAHENNRLTLRAMQIGHDNKFLSLIMMLYISPFALAANFFSMDGKVMPFLPPNPKSFLGVLLFFAVMGALPLLVTLFSNRVLKWRGRIPSTVPLDGLHLDLGRRRPPTTDEENRPG
ncbi:uncharacterized protein PV07_07699 [Cladophialophora immunda]|uniref:Uncharacterized protein n=1 Tax=Cladophialophora immunda TaxID=569365 RepID=A0A0D2ASE0_9EURO|nr:uncharacterized protein PV07_07699 [Cladophialophora immunda]KIW28007.1 hypothetical protein PV07_07699 [Cladophialophora immunda]